MFKRVRVAVAAIVFCACLLVFLGGESLARALSQVVRFFQFTPSVVTWFSGGAGLAAVGFVAILVLTVLFGRLYCAALCPLGILQDITAFVSRRVRKKRRYTYAPARDVLRFLSLIAVAVSLVAGTMALVALLDPFSLFGRVTSLIILPAWISLQEQAYVALERWGIYRTWSSAFFPLSVGALLATLALVGFALVTAWSRGRLYCNTVCPLGALLGIVAVRPLYRIRLDNASCHGCGRCSEICPAQCIDAAQQRIDETRCTRCFDCLQVCPGVALSFGRGGGRAAAVVPDLARRKTLRQTAVAGSALALLALPPRRVVRGALRQRAPLPILPPGAMDIDHFRDHCIACYLCSSVCPTKILVPSWLEHGVGSMLQPKVSYAQGWCDFSCNACGAVCPTGAIQPLALADKQRLQIGLARLVLSLCVVELEQRDCGACAEVCPTRAVTMERRGALFYPVLRRGRCIGCGYCELACPMTDKAIFVEPVPVQRQIGRRRGQGAGRGPGGGGRRDLGGEAFPF